MIESTDGAPDWKARAEAAERTVEVLSRKVMALYGGHGQSTIERQLVRAQRRQEQARSKREVMEVRARELERHTAALEREVQERTAALRVILDHVACGFLVVDRTFCVQPGYTKSCHALLGLESLAGRPIATVMGMAPAGWLDVSLTEVFEDLLPEALTLSQIPSRFVVGGRVLRAEASAVRGAGPTGPVDGILFTLTDVSRQEEAEAESRNQAGLIGILRQREAFRGFLMDTRSMIDGSRAALATSDVVLVRRALHTIKGNAGCYDLHEVVQLIHTIEGQPVIGESDLSRVEAALRSYLERNVDVLGIAFDEHRDDVFEVTEADVQDLRRIADAHRGLADVERWAAQIVLKRADVLIGPVEPFVAKLAARLEKRVHLEITGRDVLVDTDRFRAVVQNLTHLVRNAVDHGIEPAYARGAKPEEGTVRLAITEESDAWTIEVRDDGRGIDVERVVRKALERGHVTPGQARAMSESDKLELVFLDGLSTAEQATDISGRGVGMSSVRAAVAPFGGTVVVSSTRGAGTSVRLTVPKPAALMALQRASVAAMPLSESIPAPPA